ncbi:glycine cleavage system aminomethyltransferase GcvT [Hugenholtzia roseola]|uniref:glycine cleavage system aminomethyltransferase GcvT n=1 Tax=Hugenholtzia roseola TaxID=1002 RepID=UPI0005500105|nr:glycine cleavage system aminomethyltransferase GcvT [Hugenholtzia roseola]
MNTDTNTLQKVALHHIHEQLGAKLVPFAGFQMPVWYSSQNAEHQTVRQKVGIFDVSHMGEFLVSGVGATDFLQYVTSNDVSSLYEGKVQYSCLPNGKGGIVDDLLVYRLGQESYLLVVNASNIEKDWNWLLSHKPEGVEMRDISAQTSLFAVQGKLATDALQPLTEANLGSMKYYHFIKTTFAGVPDVLISTTGYTGAGGYEVYVPNEAAEKVWQAIMESGAPQGIQPIGLAARDTLRLEMGFCLYGNDIDDSTSPIEAGLGWITKFNKNFIDADLLKKQKEEGTSRKLVGLEILDKGIARQHHQIFDAEGNLIGEITSGTQSPTLKISIGMAYLNTPFHKIGSEVFVEVREGKRIKAKVVKMPFLG